MAAGIVRPSHGEGLTGSRVPSRRRTRCRPGGAAPLVGSRSAEAGPCARRSPHAGHTTMAMNMHKHHDIGSGSQWRESDQEGRIPTCPSDPTEPLNFQSSNFLVQHCRLLTNHSTCCTHRHIRTHLGLQIVNQLPARLIRAVIDVIGRSCLPLTDRHVSHLDSRGF